MPPLNNIKEILLILSFNQGKINPISPPPPGTNIINPFLNVKRSLLAALCVVLLQGVLEIRKIFHNLAPSHISFLKRVSVLIEKIIEIDL